MILFFNLKLQTPKNTVLQKIYGSKACKRKVAYSWFKTEVKVNNLGTIKL